MNCTGVSGRPTGIKQVVLAAMVCLWLCCVPAAWAEDSADSGAAGSAAEGTAPAPPSSPFQSDIGAPPVAGDPVAAPGGEESAPPPADGVKADASLMANPAEVAAAEATPPVSLSIGDFGSGATSNTTPLVIRSETGGVPYFDLDNRADQWFKASLAVAEGYNSNVFLRSDKQSDFITRVSPALAFNYLNPRLDWNLATLLDYRYYAQNTRTTDYNYSLSTGGKITLLKDLAFIVVSDRYRQTSQSNDTSTTVTNFVNVTDVNTLNVGPRFEIPLSSRVKFNPRYTYSNSWYPSDSYQNRESHQLATDISYEFSDFFNVGLGYSYIDASGSTIYTQHYPFLLVNYKLDRITLRGSIGYSRTDLEQSSRRENMVWDAGIEYRRGDLGLSLSSSSDIDQLAYNNVRGLNNRRSPQLITKYSGGVTYRLRRATLALTCYYTDYEIIDNSQLLTRTFGNTGSLSHDLGARLKGIFDYRIEEGTYFNQNLINPSYDKPLRYEIGYRLAYTFGREWLLSGIYRYSNSNSPIVTSTHNYTANTMTVELRKTF